MPKKFMNVNEAKDYVRLAKSTIYDYVHENKIPHFKVGDRVLFDENDLSVWMEGKKRVEKHER